MNIEKILAQTASDVRKLDRVEDWGYHNLSGSYLDYVLNFAQRDLVDDINALYLKNPLASRIINAKTNYTIGDGLNYHADDKEVQKILEDFMWRNKWDIKLEMKANDLAVAGELIILPEVSENAGNVTIRTPSVRRIAKRKLRHPYDDEIAMFTLTNDPEEYEIMYWDEAAVGYEGNAFLFYINKLSHYAYGLSDLFTSRDWLNLYDKSLFATMSRVGMLLSFVWDITIDTSDERIIKKKLEDLKKSPPTPGSMRIHNKNEVWKAESPKLNGKDLDEIYRLFRGQTMAGQGTPEFIFGLGGDVNYACHTEDTETLTENGWKHHWNIDPSEKIATYNPETKMIEYHIPEQKYLYDIDDDIYYIRNVNVDVAVTKDHEMLMSTSPINPMKKVKVQDISSEKLCFNDGVNGYEEEARGSDRFILPAVGCQNGSKINENNMNVSYDMKDWLEFLGIWIAEGGIAVKDMIERRSYHGTLIQKDNWEKIKDILGKLEISYDMHDDKNGIKCFNIYGKKIIKWLYDNTGSYSYNKYIPREFMNLNKEMLTILFNALMYGDGSWDAREGRNSGYYATTSKQLASDVQEIAFKLGYRAKMGTHYESFMHSDGYMRRKCYRVLLMPKTGHMQVSQTDIEKERYVGKVYCYNVENHLFITRRNGRIGIHGNTAKTMLEPYFKDIKARQKYWQYIFRSQFDYVIWNKVKKGVITKNTDINYTVGFAPPSQAAIADYSDGLSKFATAVVMLEANGVIEKEDSFNIIKLLVGQFGVDIYDDEEKASTYTSKTDKTAAALAEKLRKTYAKIK